MLVFPMNLPAHMDLTVETPRICAQRRCDNRHGVHAADVVGKGRRVSRLPSSFTSDAS